MLGKKWVKEQYSETDLKDLLTDCNYSRPIALALVARGITKDKVDSYFNADLEDLSSPYRIPGVFEAVERIWKAIQNDEKISIHGDFDVDGITASALLAWILSEHGANISVYIPHRLDTGYGFTIESLEKSLENSKFSLLITVDCGITSVEAVKRAKELGIDVIVTDHHQQGTELPEAHTIINTKLHSELQDLHSLAGVGTAFKLAHAFVNYATEEGLVPNKIDLDEILDLVALGTVADIVPLLGENRVLTKRGIHVLAKQIRPGIRALCEMSGIRFLNSNDIAYKLAPHINAAGRLGDPLLAYKLLATSSIIDAMSLAETLKNYNEERRAKEKEIFDEAAAQIHKKFELDKNFTITIYGNDWHQGIIGNVASRIVREYNKSAIVLTVIDGVAYGSGRASGNINLVSILSECSNLLIRYGGHPMAVGLSLYPGNIEAFKARVEESVKKILTIDDLIPKIGFNGDIFLSEITDSFFKELKELEPFGHANTQPVYRIRNLSVVSLTTVGTIHSRGTVKDFMDNTMQFIVFNLKPKDLPPSPWSVLAIPQLNEYHGNFYPQLRIVDIKPSEYDK